MERRETPPTAEGWFALHDFRTVDWDAWRRAPDRDRERAVEEGRAYLDAAEAVEDADEGASATYAVVGHKADLLVVHLRPTLSDLDAAERRFEATALAGFTDRANSYVSVTEASGYTPGARPFFEDDPEALDEGLRRYMETRLHPTLPDAEHVCFYPMSKRRGPDHNWYDLPLDERADYMSAHGEIGREYAGKVTQMITSSVGFDDWEWGVTLFANDAVQVKRLLYEMRFDPSTSRFAEFGPFVVGRRLPPERLGAYLAGEPLGEAAARSGDSASEAEREPTADSGEDDADEVRAALADLDVYAGQPHGEDVYAMVLYSEADADDLFDAAAGLRSNFDHYDTHVTTAVYEARGGDETAAVSIWETASAAETAGGFLADLPGIVDRADEGVGFGTMGMFYRVRPERRDDFVEKFEQVGELLADMDGHVDTDLMVNVEDETDMFIASRWRSKDDALAFFRSEAFRDAVDWGRDVLADRPRHVFFR